MSMTDPVDALAKMAESLGLGPADLAEAALRLGPGTDAPTVAEIFDEVVESCSQASRPTYLKHFKRLAADLGSLKLDEVTPAHLEALRDATVIEAARAKIERAIALERPLLSYEETAHGQGAGENAVRAFRFYFRHAVKARKLTVNPAMDVAVPRRKEAPERPLETWELEEVALAWCCTGNDPELDTLLFEFHRKTAARRVGGLNLRLGHLDVQRGAVTLNEKFGETRQLPLDAGLLVRLTEFARSRGATTPSDHVFLQRSGRPITHRRYETIYDRVDECTTWTRAVDLGVHWIRHTTLDDIRKVGGLRVASAYAGHKGDSVGTIGIYTKVTFEELAAAFEAVFGDRFPADRS